MTKKPLLRARIHVLLCTAAVAALGGLGCLVHRSGAAYRACHIEHIRIHDLESTIVRLDEILTASAQMATATGDPAWRRRYDLHKPQLDAALVDARALAPGYPTRRAVENAVQVNSGRLELEKRAFEFSNSEDASALLGGADYEKCKSLFSKSMLRFMKSTDRFIMREIQKHRITAFVASGLCALVLLLGAFSGFSAWFMHRQHALRRRADTRLVQIRGALDGATDAVAITDPNGELVYANNAFRALFKQPAEQIDTIFCNRQLFVDIYRKALEKACWEGETQLASGDGRIFVSYLRCSPILDLSSVVVGILILATDISQRKEAERALKESCCELEKANRELKEMQFQLIQKEKLASIGQLAAGVAHEMNTPVGFVASNFQTLEDYMARIRELLVLYRQLLKELEAGEETLWRCTARTITAAAETMHVDFILKDLPNLFQESKEGLDRVTSIVRNLRDFSRVDQPDSYDQYDINDGIRATLVVAQNEIKYVADVETDLAELPCIRCHSRQINQVFLNVLVNAAQALKLQNRQDRGLITVRTRPEADSVVCEISDNGPGIGEQTLSRIFDPFFTTKPVGVGTGLGLSVSYDIIVNKHGGRFSVRSAVGEGTTFTIELPLTANLDTADAGNETNAHDAILIEAPGAF